METALRDAQEKWTGQLPRPTGFHVWRNIPRLDFRRLAGPVFDLL